METRMKNPALVIGANSPIQMMMGTIYQSGISQELLEYVGLRVGQINNCELCIGASFSKGINNPAARDRITKVLEWQQSGVFTDAEQAALEITEAITILKDSYNSVPDSLWAKIEKYYNETERAALILFICTMNMFTRMNVATRQLTVDWE